MAHERNRFNKPFKENVTGEGSMNFGMVKNTGNKQVNRETNQSISMDNDLDDY
ncbi:hypothetical protein Ddye_004426 [Dipteronia dyeriana]|uniref:Uncharacterized protein n=1 Tax=Dipteronia dyeriana TaxID=168575 RepID=A0AAD9XVL0_9ROSI|nr:hypothetical protein Ddye_004426 [Dipteronia dyeriana]